jgi:hypothetical protein
VLTKTGRFAIAPNELSHERAPLRRRLLKF